MNNPFRCFIAIELEKAFQDTIADVQQRLKDSSADVSWVKPQIAHITLKFLGDVPAKKIDSVKETFRDALKDSRKFEITLEHWGAFPKIEFPQIIWIGVQDETQTCLKIADILENKFATLGFKKERREFHPHITIGRIRSGKSPGALTEALRHQPVPHDHSQTVEHVTLFKSTLTSQGPIYDPLETFHFSQVKGFRKDAGRSAR